MIDDDGDDQAIVPVGMRDYEMIGDYDTRPAGGVLGPRTFQEAFGFLSELRPSMPLGLTNGEAVPIDEGEGQPFIVGDGDAEMAAVGTYPPLPYAEDDEL